MGPGKYSRSLKIKSLLRGNNISLASGGGDGVSTTGRRKNANNAVSANFEENPQKCHSIWTNLSVIVHITLDKGLCILTYDTAVRELGNFCGGNSMPV